MGWLLQLGTQHDKYSFRQREARLSTVKTGFIFLYLFTYFHDVFTSSAKVWGDLSVTTWLEVKQINRDLINALVCKFHWQNNTSCMVVRHPDSTACNTRLILLNILLKKQKNWYPISCYVLNDAFTRINSPLLKCQFSCSYSKKWRVLHSCFFLIFGWQVTANLRRFGPIWAVKYYFSSVKASWRYRIAFT